MLTTDSLSAWHDGCTKLLPANPPCLGFRLDEWREIHTAAKLLLETRPAEAAG